MEYVIDVEDWCMEVLRDDPRSEAFVELAENLYRDQKWEKLADICRRGLTYHPHHLRARVLYGIALVELGDVEKGRRELEGARCMLEKNADLYGYLAKLAADSGNEALARRFQDIHKNMRRCSSESLEGEDFAGEVCSCSLEGLAGYGDLPTFGSAGAQSGASPGGAFVMETLTRLLDSVEEMVVEPGAPLGLLDKADRHILRRALTARQ
jgi:tetratricopeptide (TPR) repeat protein